MNKTFINRKSLVSLGAMMCLSYSPVIMAAPTQGVAITQQSLKKVTGTVSDEMGPIMGATVREVGTSRATVTDLDGNFTLEVAPGAQLEISYVGMKKLTVTVGNQNKLDLTMQPDSKMLEDVVVVGYGVQKKKLVTGATIQVKGDDVARLNTTSALGALQSQTPGVNIVSSNGQPGAGYKVNIRGIGTVGDSAPLYVIDGVAGGDINTLNPSDIESIDVLKDAASAAIYGSRAANGVILVTTKQGKEGKVSVNYDMYVGWQNVYKMPNTLNAQQRMALTDEYNFNSGIPAYDWHTQLGDYTWNMLQNGWKGTNWLDEMHIKNAITQNHAINITGGSERSKFSLGLSYTSQDGIIGKGTQPNYTRYTGRINSSHVILKGKDRDIIKFGENLTTYYSHSNGIAQTMATYTANDISNAVQASPLLPLYNENGELFSYKDMAATGWVLSDKQSNPMLVMQKSHGMNITRIYGLSATAYMEIEPIKSLRWRSSVSYRMTNTSGRSLGAPYQGSANDASTGFNVGQSSALGHNVSQENTIYYKLPALKGHEFDVLIGQSVEKTIPGDNLNVGNSIEEGKQLPTMKPDMDHAWLSNTFGTATSNFVGYPFDEWALASVFGRINYSYKDKYMATFIVRSDGSSNFAKGHRWGTFPSVSAGWVISEEKFMQQSRSWLDFLKLRASWGQNGNQQIPNFQYVSPVSFDYSHGYMFGNTHIQKGALPSTGAYATNLANEDVTWEKSEQLDLGIDMVMLNSRLRLTADWYKKTTKDWLVQAPVLSTAGTAAPYINGGDVENKGIEFAVNWNDNIGELRYGVSVNASYNKNEVTRIANTEGIIHGNTGAIEPSTAEFYRAQVGYPIGYFWGFKTAGVFQNQQQIIDWMAAGNGVAQAAPQPGDLIYQDLNHDGVIDENDKTMIGNPHPDWNVGFSLNLAWRGFDFGATAAGAFGQQLYFGQRKNTIYAFDRWHGEGTSNRFPRLVSNAPLSEHASDFDIEDGDYLRMQNITLGYDFKHLWKSSPLQRMRLYVTVQNLFTITGYKGMDPEVGFGGTDRYGQNATSWVTGIDMGSYPSARTWMIGANLTF